MAHHTLNSFALPRYKCTHFLNVSCFFFMSQIREQKLRVISSVVFFPHKNSMTQLLFTLIAILHPSKLKDKAF